MDKPAIDNLHDPTRPEVYYFDDRTREQVRAKQEAFAAEQEREGAEASKKPVKKAGKKA